MRAVLTVIRAAARRRRMQTLVIGTVALLSTATVVLAAGLLVLSDAPFDHAFAQQSGAHAVAVFDGRAVSAGTVRATGSAPGVTASAGPYDSVGVRMSAGPLLFGTRTVVGRADPGGPVDRLSLHSGQWLTGPGQVVLSGFGGSGPPGTGVGSTVTVNGVPLRVVGTASSVTHTADAWVWPTQRDVLVNPDHVMLYRFSSAGDDAAVAASLARAVGTLPLLGSSSYLVAKRDADSSTAPVVPFVVAFAILGIVMSVLVVANIVNGAVVAGYRAIGVLKTLGFSPGQVVAGYTGQILLPGLVGTLVGIPLGNLLAVPLLAQAGRAYAVATTGGVAGWVDAAAALGMPALVALAAVLPATRAGRLPATQAISVGRAPRTGRGYRIRRALAGTPLPFPVRYGLGTPFARPARTAVTLVAVLLGAVTVVFAAGLASSLDRVSAAAIRTGPVPVEVDIFHGGPTKVGTLPDTADPATVLATVRSQPGTARVVGVDDMNAALAGYTEPVTVESYDGDATWVGLQLISGRWYAGPGEAVAGSGLLRATGHRVGDTVTIGTDLGRREVHIVGEIFDLQDRGRVLVTGSGTVAGLAHLSGPAWFAVALAPGTVPDAYVEALSDRLGFTAKAQVRDEEGTAQTFTILLTLVGTLTVLLSVVSALGVLNTVVLNTRERAVEIGVLKTLGMTPRQVRLAVVTSMAGIGLLAGLLAIPLGTALHDAVLPVMADAAGTRIPASFVAVYTPVELVGLGAAGIALGIIGALLPAGWAARSRIAHAMRAE